MKNTRAAVIVTVSGVSLPVVQFFAFNGLGHWTEFPGDPPLTVQFLLSFFAHLAPWDKSGHAHHSLPWRT
jgi:hypothetical protein